MEKTLGTRLKSAAILTGLLVAANSYAQPFGSWDFNSSNLTATVAAASLL